MSGIVGGYGCKSGHVNGPQGSMRLLDERQVSDVATVAWSLTPEYDSYELHIMSFYAASGSDMSDIRVGFSADGGSAFLNEISMGSFHNSQNGTTFVHLSHTGASNYGDDVSWRIANGVDGDAMGGSQGQAAMSGWLKLINTNGKTTHASTAKMMYGSSFMAYPHSANASYGTYSHMYMPLETAPLNYFKLDSSAVDVYGTFKLYGLKQ